MAASINRSVSPMLAHRENFEESRNVVNEKIEKLKQEQKARSPFLIGSIEEVSRRISLLDRKLQTYTELVVESRASDFPEVKPPSTAARRERCDRRERDEKELTKFAGVYSIKSTFGVATSERVKNVSKISMDPNKAVTKKDTTGKPKFVELYQYGGYDSSQTTALPDGVSAYDILVKVTKAQPDWAKKSTYKVAFEKIFLSRTSQAILLDTFWWCFLNRFYSDKDSQWQLFKRISLNYVNLLLSCNDIHVREAFLRDYPDLLAQSVYASFCEAFIDSYRQFDNAFKEMIVCTTSEWVVGTKPAPGSYRNWNYAHLEPANIKMREEMMKKKDDGNNGKIKGGSVLNLENIGVHSSTPTSSKASVASLTRDSVTSSSQDGQKHVRIQDPIVKVAQAQNKQRKVGVASPHSEHLPTIRESRSGEADDISHQHTSTESESATRSSAPEPDHTVYWNKRYCKPRESHPACRGPDFSRNAFNVHGQSPLVAQFLDDMNLTSRVGCDVTVQRTEIDRLPAADEETYLDLVKKGYQRVRDRRRETQALFTEGKRESAKQARQHHSELKQLQNKQAALLTNPREVKRICNLIILEQRKDEDSIPAGVETALQQALDQSVLANASSSNN